MAVNSSKPAGAIVPSLIYRDLGQAIDWLCDVFGFTERLRITGPDGTVGHAQLAVGEGGILLGQARSDRGIEYRAPRPNEHAKQRGARILEPPATHPYGERQYSALDIEGHRWAFSQTVADVKPEDWGATTVQ